MFVIDTKNPSDEVYNFPVLYDKTIDVTNKKAIHSIFSHLIDDLITIILYSVDFGQDVLNYIYVPNEDLNFFSKYRMRIFLFDFGDDINGEIKKWDKGTLPDTYQRGKFQRSYKKIILIAVNYFMYSVVTQKTGAEPDYITGEYLKQQGEITNYLTNYMKDLLKQGSKKLLHCACQNELPNLSYRINR